jgi:sugar lactone lactonase YvrE
VRRLPPGGGEPEIVVPKRKGVGGLVLHADGGAVIGGRDLVHVRDGESRTVLAVDGISGFNDLTTDSEGRVVVGGLRFFPFKGEAPAPSAVWRAGVDGSSEVLFDEGILWPNGMGYSPDGSVLYASDYAAACILAWDGSRVRTLAEAPRGECDGLAVDVEGGVWVALGNGGAIARFSPEGDLTELLDVPAAFVASLCLHEDDLWVTAVRDESGTGGVVMRAPAPARGLPVPRARV